MPRFEDGCHSCANTASLISKILAGKGEMKYTRAAVGSGIIPEGQTPRTLTEPPGYVMDGILANVGNPVDGECQVQVQVPSSMVDTSFKCTGVMLYALDPVTEEEVPYTYLCLETESEEIRSKSNAVGKIAVFDLITVVGEVKNVSAVIDPNAMATHASVESMFAQKLNRRDITIPTEGWILTENAPATVVPPIVTVAESDEQEAPPAEEQTSILYYVDVPVSDITENCMADLKIVRADSQLAAACGLSFQCESLDGILRLYALTAPEKPINGQLALIELSRRNGNSRMLGTVSIACTDASNIIYKGRPISALLAGLEDLAETSRAITAVPTQLKVDTYDGTEKTLQLNGFDGAAMILSGVTAATEAGWYEAVVTPKTGYYWMSDGTATSRIIRWRIAGISVPIPASPPAQIYTGATLRPNVVVDAEDGVVTFSGTTEATAAGTYTMNASLAENYEWEDGTTGDKTILWVINKAANSITLNKTSLTLNIASLTGYINVTRAGNGAITARSSNTAVATVSVSGEQITVVGKAKGSATITVSVAAGTNHLAAADKTCSVTVSIPSTDPNQNTMDENQQLIQSGQAKNYWKVGDAMDTKINGNVAGQILNLNLKTIILDFDYQKTHISSGKPNVIYGLAWKDAKGNDVALCDSNIHGTVPKNGSGFCMNPGDSSNNYGGNSGGWNLSYMRKNILPQLFNILSDDLRGVITAAKIYTDNTGNGNSNASGVTSTSDKLWLPNEMEVFGATNASNTAEANYTSQLAYFKNGNTRIAKNASNVSQAVDWWLRSPQPTTTRFLYVYTGGALISSHAYVDYGVRACFMIA